MPQQSSFNNITRELPITTLASASYQINGGTAITGAIEGDATPISDTVTVTGVKTTDKRLSICPRDAVVLPTGLQLISLVCAANDAVIITWRNVTENSITPPAAGVWSLAILGNFIRS
jgi:hypothetical protein